MDGLKKLHQEQDDFIKKTFQADKLVSQPVFDNFSVYMEQSKIKVKKYTYKQQKIIILLLLLLIISVGFNIYLGVVKQTPISITTIFNQASTDDKDVPKENGKGTLVVDEDKLDELVSDKTEETPVKDSNTTIEQPVVTPEPEPEPVINTTITPTVFTDVDTKEVAEFVDQIAIGINRLSLEEETLESNTILLYIAQQYFTSKSNKSSTLEIDTTYASSVENIHKFLSELTIKDYSTVNKISSYNNYIGYTARSKSYVYGADYATLSKEKYECTDVTVSNKEDNIYTATAKVTRTLDSVKSTYDVTFTFKVNNNYKYQKYKILSIDAVNTSDLVDTTIHFVEK